MKPDEEHGIPAETFEANMRELTKTLAGPHGCHRDWLVSLDPTGAIEIAKRCHISDRPAEDDADESLTFQQSDDADEERQRLDK